MIWGAAGILLAAAAAYYLVKEMGYEGGYFDEFFVSVLFQAMFVGGVCLALWGFGCFRMTYLWIAVGVSFLWPMLGVFLFRRPEMQYDRKTKSLYKAIRNGAKCQAFLAFVKANADRIGAIYKNGTVRYAPEGTPLFTTKDNGYEITTEWNPDLGHPLFRLDGAQHPLNWQSKPFFGIQSGERGWTFEEEQQIRRIVEESLPGGKENWGYYSDYSGYYRNLPKVVQKKQRKDPY